MYLSESKVFLIASPIRELASTIAEAKCKALLQNGDAMTKTDKILTMIFGQYVQIDDVNEYSEKSGKNGACPHLTQRGQLTLSEFKARLNSNVLTDEDVIKAVYNSLPDVNSNAFYRNGSIYLKSSPLEDLLRKYQSDSPAARKFAENKLLLRDIIQMMDEYGKAPEPNKPLVAEYARALAKASICYVDDKYDGKENN